MAKKLIKEYVFSPGLGLGDNARPNATSLLEFNKVFLAKEYVAYIQGQVDVANPDYTSITYNYSRLESDANAIVDALIFDLRYNGNEKTREVASTYWEEDVAQIPGNRIAETEALTYITTLVKDYVLQNSIYQGPEQNVAIQYVDLATPSEAGANTLAETRLEMLNSVIELGLDEMSDLEVGLGRIELLGKLGLEDVLIITNVTDNIVIYNFADSTKGGQVDFSAENTTNYPQAESVNNGVTVINFNFTTTSMSADDEIQIFLEESELSVRMNSIATDAMERLKVGIPQAMLDADFEYGLQPTKWQAIATQRGYPAAYEVPASDIVVETVVTDASSNSNDVGASIITVTTQAAHGLEVGDVITIRALASSVIGFNRAEGTFLITAVPSNNVFEYYAKSKVGTTDGEEIASSSTQLRQAKFYTGSDVAGSTFTVPQQGGSGSFTTALDAPSGDTALSYSGTVPPIGVNISGTGIPAGSQITAIYGSNNTNGVETTKYVSAMYMQGSTTLSLVNTTDVTAGMMLAVNGSAGGTQSVITSINGNQLTLSRPLTVDYQGDQVAYSGLIISSSNYISGSGTGATFDVTIEADLSYTVNLSAGGAGYQQGDTLRILGTALGGASPANDIYVTVDDVTQDATSAVQMAGVISTTSGTSAASYTGVASSQSTNPFAANGQITILRSGGVYSSAGVTNGGTGIYRGNRFTIAGDDLNGAVPTNNAIVTITGTNGEAVTSFTVTGSGVRGNQIEIYSGIGISEPITQTINDASSISYTGIATINVEFADPHGLYPGSALMVDVKSVGTNHDLVAGPYFVNEVIDENNIQYIARSTGTIDITDEEIDAVIYTRPDAFFTHRPFDGGVQLGTGSPQHGNHAIRMSKKYIRYQSGKGAMYNTGALFAPSFDIGSITATGTDIGSTITVETDDSDHGLQSGSTIRITGCQTVGYNGDYIVNQIINERSFTIPAQKILGNTTGELGSQCQMSLLYWHGAVVRSGSFDDQNGIFWQYDGQEMALGRRSSTFTIAGTISVETNGRAVTGLNTRFQDQLEVGDRVVIRGMTHVINRIESNTSMSITPGYRGVNSITGVKVSKVQDLIIPQSEWNLDRCDGTGPSGYEIDVTKMQMIGIQFTWYGAGFIDWMLRGPSGDYIFCHRLKGNNLNTEAYMRTGNLPVRYEVLNEGPKSRLDGGITNIASSLVLKDAKLFPNSGTIFVDNELISYTSKTGDTLQGLTRATTLNNFAAGSNRTYTAGSATSHADKAGVTLISSTTSPIISHWGSAYLIDGQFDDDRGYIFSYAATNLEISSVKNTAFLIRLSPSVSNAVIGDLGERELLNRAQLLLKDLSVVSDGVDPASNNDPITGGIVIEGVLNPQNYPINPNDIAWNGLNNASAGGQPSFAQIALGSSVEWSGGVQQVTETATLANAVTITENILQVFNNNRYVRSGRDRVYLTDTDFSTTGLQIGDVIDTTFSAGANFDAGTSITSIVPNWDGTGWTRLNLSKEANTDDSVNTQVRFIAQYTGATYNNTNRLVFTDTTWEAANLAQGVPVAATQSEFPPNTQISTILARTFGTTIFYTVTFSQSFRGTLNAGATVTFDKTPPPNARPGETVFSFTAQPGERSSLDLSELKELTTTTLGGRGAFPNGPDVLAVNVYKTSGDSTNATVLLRWGEAQA